MPRQSTVGFAARLERLFWQLLYSRSCALSGLLHDWTHGGGRDAYGCHNNQVGGNAMVSASQANYHITGTVHSLDITDQMREAAMRGQPLWRGAGPQS